MNDKLIKGIIFDMDNTLLRSNINFKAMKSDVIEHLMRNGLISPGTRVEDHTTATLIEAARSSGLLTDSLDRYLWDIVRQHEVEGMREAKLEPHVEDVLDRLYAHYVLTILTNNAHMMPPFQPWRETVSPASSD